MNKKAFTLAEILGVIVVIGLLLVIIAPTIINRINSKEENVEEAANRIIFDAASQYIAENRENFPLGKRYCISIKDLIEAGKLAAPVKNVKTGENMENTYVVEVSLYSLGDSYYELRETCECDSTLPMIDFKVEPPGANWAQKRNVTILYPEGGSEFKYKKDNGGWESYSQAIEFNKNGTLTAQMKYNGTVIRSKINISKIDPNKPKVSLSQNTQTSYVKGGKDIIVTIRDEESGLRANQRLYYAWTTSTSTPTSGWSSVSMTNKAGEKRTQVKYQKE